MADSSQMPEVEEHDLTALIANEISAATLYDDSEMASKRSRALEYLRGEMTDVESRPNGSTVTSRDVADTVSWMLPGIMRVFMASDRMAEYEPTFREGTSLEQAEEYAEQASDYASWVFFKDNPGYRVLYNTTHEALTLAAGIVKHWWDETPEEEITVHSCLTMQQLTLLMQDEDVEILEQEEGYPVAVQDEMGQTLQVPSFSVKVKRTTRRGRLRVDSIERENFLIDEAALTIEDARFCAHRDPYVTRSDLIERGFDREMVEDLSGDDSGFLDSEEGGARHDNVSMVDQSLLRSTQRIDLYECYIKADADGDGIAEMLQVWYAGQAGSGKVLDWQVWEDDVPFTDIPCYPMPHKFDGESVFDRTEDIQRVKTVLWRQYLDNLYASNNPMQEVEEGSVLNPDILVSPKFGGLIWKKRGSAPIIPREVPMVADKALAALEYADAVVEKRTGVSRTMMALDPEALQNQTATANQNARDAAYSQTELVARNMAELGWRRVFRQILKLIVKHQDRPRIIRLRGEFTEMDPRPWNASMDCTVNVGLGTGSRDRDMAMLQVVVQHQWTLIQMFAEKGFAEQALEMLPKLLAALRKMAESAGLKNAESYYPEIDDEKLQAMAQQVQQSAQQPSEAERIEAAKLQADQERTKMQAEGDIVRNKAELEADMMTKAADREQVLAVKALEAQLAREKMAADAELKREEIMSRERIAFAQLQQKEADRVARNDASGSAGGGGAQAA